MKKISIYGHRSTHLCIGLFCFLFFISTPFWGQEQQYRFEYIGLEQGLPQEQVLKIIEDKEGFLWFGTMEGLVKYNGYDFTLFQPIHGDSTSLSSPIVDQILEDQEGFVWVGTHNGLNCYDRSTDSFKRYLHDDGDANSLQGNYVTW